jgi:restriction endonuclease Mrr
MECVLIVIGGAVFFYLLSLVEAAVFKAQSERTRIQHEQWLKSPEGKARIAEQKRIRLEEEREQERIRREAERERQEAEERRALSVWERWHAGRSLASINEMTGSEFERFLAGLLAKIGFTEITTTPPTDQGGDILAVSPSGEAVVVQAKRWSKPVGNKAVQELLGAMLHYSRPRGLVITNSRFTSPACELASKDRRIELYDGGWLEARIKEAYPEEVPEFTWARYRHLIQIHPEAVRIDQHPTSRKPYRRWKKRRRRF